jgi:hypothetical protein
MMCMIVSCAQPASKLPPFCWSDSVTVACRPSLTHPFAPSYHPSDSGLVAGMATNGGGHRTVDAVHSSVEAEHREVPPE